ncbi:MAG: coagulation factor 5/8 type domain-containing protein [Gemmatimonadetes bacterium]|nr:MAG: coagulation factor 5/8 type domain-containing protein [Gemmatimonadota bacterium]
MNCRSAFLLIGGIVSLRVQAQTPPTSSPPSNPPAPTPIPTVVPANPVTAAPAQTAVPTIVLDNFDSVTQWTTAPAEGVEVSVHPDPNGAHGNAMRVDFDFHGHGGYAVIHRALNLTLPANYEFSFAIKGQAPTNTLEFKLIDSTGDNVWWSNNPDFHFPKDWTTVTRKKRQISFAWGPTNDRELKKFAAIEIAITAGSGGKGSIWLDDLALTPLGAETRFYPAPNVTASSQVPGYEISRAFDADMTSAWRSAPVRVSATTGGAVLIPPGSVPPGTETIDIDFLGRREFSGLVLTWEPGRRANTYSIQSSQDKQNWRTLYTAHRTSLSPLAQTSGANRAAVMNSPLLRDYIYLPESDARYLRILLVSPEVANGYGIRDIAIKPLDWAANANDFFMAVAKDAPRGSYPRPFSSEQSYWTVLGVDRDSAEALVNEDGMIEVGRGQFSIEPFLFTDGKLVTWNDARTSVAGNVEGLPLPQVVWSAKDIDLTIAPFAAGPVDSSVLYARYRIANNSRSYKKLTLYLAMRPFQVNPPWQFLNLPGGVATIDSISLQGSTVRLTGNKFVRALASPSGFGALAFDDGNIVDWLRAGKLPVSVSVVDPTGHASAAFAYQLELGPHATSSPIDLAVPLHGGDLNINQLLSAARSGYVAAPTTVVAPRPGATPEPAPGNAPGLTLLPGQGERAVSSQLEQVTAEWRQKMGPASITLPPSAARYTQTLRTQLADILINRDGPAIQPGSRSYSRSWIRDGSLTSTALLRLGHDKDVKDFIDWFANYQYDNGKIPCCVDEHGATPVPENDSHGEFIYLVAEYYRHTGDKAELEKMWPHVAKAVAYMDSLRHQRMTAQYTVGANKPFFGLLPESISHEGYSAKPVHSYWDDFFALRGFKDAAFIAKELGKPEANDFAQMRNSFRGNLFESIRQVVITRKIDYIPGSVELADFDPTSTTIAVTPGGEAGRLPGPLLNRTFDKYFQSARLRGVGINPWDAYTPYELRTVGVEVQLGQRGRAHELLDFFFKGQRPEAWHEWAEVVYRDAKTPKFIGDMPHTWVGSDYIRSFLDMLAYERESDSTLVIGAGVRNEWVQEPPGIHVSNLSTEYGPLNYDMSALGKVVTINLRTGIRMPPGGIVVYSPLDQPVLSAAVDGVAAPIRGQEIRVRKIPAIVTVRYAR